MSDLPEEDARTKFKGSTFYSKPSHTFVYCVLLVVQEDAGILAVSVSVYDI